MKFIFSILKKGCLFFLLILIPVQANPPEKITLSLDHAINRALKENNLLKSQKYELKRTKWERNKAWTLLFPTLDFQTRMYEIDDETFAQRDFRRYLPPELRDQIPQTVFQRSYYSSFNLSMTLFNGSIINGIFLANKQINATESMYQSQKEQVVYEVMSSYLSILKQRDILTLQAEYLELSEMNYDKAQRMFQSGRYSQTEGLRWKIDMQQQKSLVIQAQSVLRSAKANLNRLLNLTREQELQIEPDIPEKFLQLSDQYLLKSQEEILAMIDVTDEELKKINANLAAADKVKDINKLLYRNEYSLFMPNLNLSYEYGWRENNSLALDDYSPKTLSINLNFPVFYSFRNFTSVKTKYYEYKKSEQSFLNDLKNTRLLLIEAVNRIVTLKSQLELSETNVEINEQTYRMIESQKERGIVSNIDFIDAKLNFQQAKLDRIHQQFDFILSIVQLNYLLGNLNELID